MKSLRGDKDEVGKQEENLLTDKFNKQNERKRIRKCDEEKIYKMED